MFFPNRASTLNLFSFTSEPMMRCPVGLLLSAVIGMWLEAWMDTGTEEFILEFMLEMFSSRSGTCWPDNGLEDLIGGLTRDAICSAEFGGGAFERGGITGGMSPFGRGGSCMGSPILGMISVGREELR